MKTNLFLLFLAASGLANAADYQLHEWGTFTTVSGSDGVLLEGLEREEEPLPEFVHAHLGLENGQRPDFAQYQEFYNKYGSVNFGTGSKGLGRRPVKGVKVKMETPVIYFHSADAFHVHVKVGFEGGTISQWFPQRSGGETLPGPAPITKADAWTLDFSKPYHGGIEWDANVLSPEESRKVMLFKPEDTLNWVRARTREANVVKSANGETEGYLFYRGLGNFEPGLTTTVSSDETLHLTNKTGGKIPYLIVFENQGDTIRWSERRDGVNATGELEVSEKDFTTTKADDYPTLYRTVQGGLQSCGLTEQEAEAMVATWWRSYFGAPGLRVFWVLPRTTVDRILPLEVSPAPAETVRVLVGRSEVFRPSQEKQWITLSKKPANDDFIWKSILGGRFGMPIKDRVAALQAQAAK
jgi:hypothetical protein